MFSIGESKLVWFTICIEQYNWTIYNIYTNLDNETWSGCWLRTI